MKFGKGKKEKKDKKNLQVNVNPDEFMADAAVENSEGDVVEGDQPEEIFAFMAEEVVEEVPVEEPPVEEVSEEETFIEELTAEEAPVEAAMGEENVEEPSTEQVPAEDTLIDEQASEEISDTATEVNSWFNDQSEEAVVEGAEATEEEITDEPSVGDEALEISGEKPKKQKKEKKAKEPKPKKEKKVKEPKVKKEKKVKEPKPEKEGKQPKRRDKVSFFQSLQVKLLEGFMIPVICVVTLGVMSYNQASTAVVQSYEESAFNLTNTIEDYLTLVTDTVTNRYKDYMGYEDLTKYFRGVYDEEGDTATETSVRKQYTTELTNAISSDKLIEDITFLSDEQISLSSNTIEGVSVLTDSDETNDVPTTVYAAFLETDMGKAMLKDSHSYLWFGNNCDIDDKLGTSNAFYALRLVRKFDGANAAMIVDVDKEKVIESLDALNAGDGGYVAVVTGDGCEIFSTATRNEKETIFYDKDFYKEAIKSKEETGKSYVTFRDKNYLFVYSKLEDKDLTICTLVAEEYIMKNVTGIRTLTVGLVLFATVVAIAVGALLSRGISKAINAMIKSLKKVAGGDFTVQVNTKRSDEFMLMAGAITDTVEQVKGLISNVQEVNGELADAAEKVYDSSTLFMETTQNINKSVDEIKTGAYKLDEDSDNCLAQMDTLSEKIETVTANTEEISKMAEATNEAIESGITSMIGVTEGAKSTTRITGDVITAIEELQDKSRSIGTIVGVINEIAEQTNLLSLNASIEAARAGEAGRGFAVVATEISKLADQSLRSADQIKKIIEEIVGKTGHVVEIAKEAFEIVQAQDKSVSTTTEAFEEMRRNITTLLSSLEEISQNVINMESARAMTLESVENISAVSAETAACSLSVGETVDSQNNAIYSLDAAANTLSAKADQLTDLLAQFTV